ncbi:MAG TPA: GNAT family N-acetyltransferase [Mycobacteriales bacterium]|nr:GNAT family N-acetyltransferase [Mycobacteriales bacterium]
MLRPATEADLADLVRLARAFYDEDGFRTGDDDLRARFGVLLHDSDANITVATESGATVGFALTTTRLILESGLAAELQDLYVRPEHRRQGIGAALIGDAEQWARARSATLLEVVVAPNGRDVSHLHRYYGALGYVDEGRQILSRDL